VLRRERERGALLEALPGFDRLVLLGDVLELRHGPMREALAAATPVLRELGSAVAEVVVLAGNHDHGLLRGWFERRDPVVPLGLESAVESDPREPLGAVVAALAADGRGRVRVAYPGAWLREDVYAIHGHYADRHNTVPIVERLGAGLTVRLAGEPGGGPARAEDYEAALAPMYAWIDTVAQLGGLRGSGGDGSFQVKAWRALGGGGGRLGVRGRALAAAFPVGVAGLNVAGLGPLRPDVSAAELRRAGLRAFTQVLTRRPARTCCSGIRIARGRWLTTIRASGAASSTPAAGCTTRPGSATRRATVPTAPDSRRSWATPARPSSLIC